MTESRQLEYRLEDVYYEDDPQPKTGSFTKGFLLGFGVTIGAILGAALLYLLAMGSILLYGMIRFHFFS